MNKKILLILLFTVIISCNKKTIKIGQDLTFEQNISIDYGNEPEQKLDLYIPQQKDSIKTIFILIHGGGWKAGRKSDLNFFVTSLMKKFRQSAIANIDYRLATETRYGIPNQLEDIKKAIPKLFFSEIAQEDIYLYYMVIKQFKMKTLKQL